MLKVKRKVIEGLLGYSNMQSHTITDLKIADIYMMLRLHVRVTLVCFISVLFNCDFAFFW